MTQKVLLTIVYAGLLCGSIFGLISTFLLVDAQDYVSHAMYGLILRNLTQRLNQGLAAGLVLALTLLLLWFLVKEAWKRIIHPYIQLHVKKGKNPRGVFMSLHQKMKHVLSFQSLQKACIACVGVLIALNTGSLLIKKTYKFPHPNILLVVADALRADHLGCYGLSSSNSPFIDRFARSSVLFENHLTNAPWTKPAMGSLFTSLYPHQHRAYYWSDNLKNENLSMAEVFLDRNYRTLAIQSNPSITSRHNFAQGFQDYTELPIESGEKATEEFSAWLERNHKKPFFAYVHFMDTHMPYNAAHEFSSILGIEGEDGTESLDFKTLDIRILTELGLDREKKDALHALYDRAVRDIDRHFERLIDCLSKFDVLDNTLIIFTSDHGEEFWEHGGFAHGHTLYNELIHVPLIIHYPRLFSANRIPVYTQHLDVLPTLLSLTGTRRSFHMMGRNLIPIMANPTLKMNTVFFFEGILFGEEKRAILKNGWKLIENPQRHSKGTFATLGDLENLMDNEKKDGYELYDLTRDSLESVNLAGSHSNIMNELKRALLGKISSGVQFLYQRKTDLEDKLESLRALGYAK